VRSSRRLFGAIVLGLLVLVADRWLQGIMVARLTPGVPVHVLPGVNLALVENSGAAFGLFQGGDAWLAVVGVLVVAAGMAWLIQHPEAPVGVTVGLGLLLGGAVGNLWDRWISGRVVDYVAVGPWPVFNLADSAIVVGVVLLAIAAWQYDHAAQRSGADRSP
jgi:signal peptidase II